MSKNTLAFGIKGYFSGVLIKADGSVETVFKHNLVVDSGLAYILSALFSADRTSIMNYIAIGSGTVAPAASNTALGAEISRIASSVTFSANVATVTATFGAGVGTGAISEAGIFNAATNGIMLDRVVFSVKNKDADDVFTVTFEITVENKA